ncbi:MAG: class I SAM-dependent methyltransferase [Candidatus Aegiribacteria sp.]|nr:class I SAM-dependent methyltransferase [Candidatus Aegiribacteria sp.]
MKQSPPDWYDNPEYWEANRSFIWSEKRIEMSEVAAEKIAELLEMKPEESILDMACGFGRHSLALSKQGYSVTGVDLNSNFIHEASVKAEESELDARFLCADMRDFVEPESFDNIIIMYNSFGYFQDPQEDRQVLDNCLQSLKSGGKLLLSVMSREHIMQHQSSNQSRYWHEAEDGKIWLIEATANEDWTWNTIRWIVLKDNKRQEYTYGSRIYNEPELRDLLLSVGYSQIQAFGSLSGKRYNDESHHLILLAQKLKGNI